MIQQDNNLSVTPHKSISLLYSAPWFAKELLPGLNASFEVHSESNIEHLDNYLRDQSLFTLPDVILLEVDDAHECFDYVNKLKKNVLLKGLVIILLGKKADKKVRDQAMKLKVNDLYTDPVPLRDLCERIVFLVKFKLIKPQLSDLSNIDFTYKIPFSKRLFDIVTSGMALLVLSPFLLIVGLIVAAESKGPVIFKSKRVGTGYRIFDFYKFRSMRQGASEELKKLSDLNQYDKSETGDTTFVKLKNDPRITGFGRFIRKYSIDELPQLFNVFMGDMSLVGNRPLPLYEAEMLTSNEWTMRFLGPAGLTGLWQVSRRGKADMSERERKKLDNFYAQNHSFWLDLKILLKTLPAIVQKEKV
ncbi:MAG TPA: sugar transferase [Pedobacter sp.]|uniref:sugar transferase n=1 Tax=Pedobacter sp. TaxID=1411316 RepID=UPI002CAB8946|nr:sugar transferase [Pedobacter sp.]HMI01348.1 sugar transferase [Pedobacter sp.]